MSVTKAKFDALLKKHPYLEIKYSQLQNLKEIQWQRLIKVDEKFRDLRVSLTLEKMAMKEQRKMYAQNR